MLHSLCQHLHCNFPQPCSIDLAGLRGVTAKKATLEHFQGRHGQTFTAGENAAGFLGFVGPLGASAGIEENGDDEKIDQATGSFLSIDGAGPGLQQLVDTGSATHVKVLPAAMGGDRVVVGSVVSLFQPREVSTTRSHDKHGGYLSPRSP